MAENSGSFQGGDRVSESNTVSDNSSRETLNADVNNTRQEMGSGAAQQNEINRQESQMLASQGQIGNLELTDDKGSGAQAERGMKKDTAANKDAAKDNKENKAEKPANPSELSDLVITDLQDQGSKGHLKNDTLEKLGKAADQAYANGGGTQGIENLGKQIDQSIKDKGFDSKDFSIPYKGDRNGKPMMEVQLKNKDGSKDEAPLPWNPPKK